MAWCLTKDQTRKFRKAIKSGELDPFKLAEMSSEQRRSTFTKVISEENAQQVNSLFEAKILLKNQIQGYMTWVKKVSGITAQTKRDLVSRIERINKILSPKENEAFLQDLASRRLGVNITEEEANTISKMSNKVSGLKQKTDITKPDIKLGRAKLALTEYVNSISPKKANLATNIAGVPRSLMASLDLSAPLNQGWGMISRRRFYTSLKSMFSSAKSEENFKNLQAYIITHPDYETARRSGLRITELGENLQKREEQFMSSLLDRVPGISASQRAYVGFLNKLRMDSFSDLVRKAEISGETVTPGSPAAKDLANTVNSFTGGASVGRSEGAVPLLNALFFSARKVKSTINMINPATYISPKISKTARLEATRNLIGSLAMSASIIALYSLLTGKEQEKEPTSTDFGKIRSGDTRIDVTGGNATYANLLSRIILGRTKTSSGVTKKLGTGYGETSAFDLIAQFVRYKLSPNASLLVDSVTGANAIGEKKTINESIIDRFKPLFLNSVVELLESDTEGKFGFVLAGLFGAGLNTYSLEDNWEEKTTKEMIQFKDKVGEDKFKEASDKYNKEYDKWFEETRNKDEYKNLSDEAKKKLITDSKEDIKQKIFKEYEFKYKKETKSQEDKKEEDKIKKLLPKVSIMVDGVTNILNRITPTVSASEGERVVEAKVEGDRLLLRGYKEDGTYYEKSTDLYKDLTGVKRIGKLVEDLGKKLKLKEFEVSEGLGYNSEEYIQEVLDKYKKVETADQKAEKAFKDKGLVKDPDGVWRTKENSIKDKITEVPEKKIESTRSTEKKTPTKTKYNNTIKKEFGSQWINATRVLSRKLDDGRVVGENNDLFGTPEEDPAGKNTDRTNPNGSTDRGLFRINSNTFDDFYRRKKNTLNKRGIYSYDDMLDPQKNIIMAKIIYNEQGWDAWFAAPEDLLSDKEKKRRTDKGLPILR